MNIELEKKREILFNEIESLATLLSDKRAELAKIDKALESDWRRDLRARQMKALGIS